LACPGFNGSRRSDAPDRGHAAWRDTVFLTDVDIADVGKLSSWIIDDFELAADHFRDDIDECMVIFLAKPRRDAKGCT